MKIELTPDEVELLLTCLDNDICANKGCLDLDAKDCSSCKVTVLTEQLMKKLQGD